MRAWLLLWFALLCGTGAAQPVQVSDDRGHTVQLPRPAQRVVVLGPHLVELMFAAGAGDRVVGVQKYSDFPAAALRLPLVGDALALNLEAIAALKPDLLLVWDSGINARQQQRLAALKLPTFVSEINDVGQIARTLRRLGAIAGTADAAEQAAHGVESEWAALARRYAGRRPVRVFYQLWHEPLMTVNRQHLIHQAIELCGGVNVFADQAPLVPTVGWEAAVRRNPEVVLTGNSADEPARLDGWRRFPEVDAVKHQRLMALDGPALARMSPRFVTAAAQLCAAIDSARH